MKDTMEKRTYERRDYHVALSVSFFNKNKFFTAETINNCEDGICFKSDTFFRPGTAVYLRVKNFLPNTSGTRAFEGLRSTSLGEIKWCREVADADAGTYEVGVKYPGSAY